MKLHSTHNARRLSGRAVKMGKDQSGLSILEVLIALAVLSIGLAGLAIMHMNSLKYAHSAYYRSIASAVALDLEERLWLRIADTSVADCPDTSSTGIAYSELVSEWSANPADKWHGFGTKLANIRNLTVTPGTLTHTTFAEIPVTLSWTDVRFDDAESITDETAQPETYVYTIRLLCKSSSTGTVPTT